MCQDVEIVGEKSIPIFSVERFVEMANVEHGGIMKKKRKKKKKKFLEKDILAIQIVPSDSKSFIFLDYAKYLLSTTIEDNNLLKLSFEQICPTAFAWLLNKK